LKNNFFFSLLKTRVEKFRLQIFKETYKVDQVKMGGGGKTCFEKKKKYNVDYLIFEFCFNEFKFFKLAREKNVNDHHKLVALEHIYSW